MRDRRRRSSVRHGAFTGLVREEAALDARDHRRAQAAANGSLRGERIVEDQGEHRRHLAEV